MRHLTLILACLLITSIKSTAQSNSSNLSEIKIEYDRNGEKSGEGRYNKQGLKEGLWKHYGRIISLEEGNYTNGNKEGEWKSFFEDGKILQVINYRKGLKNGKLNQYYNSGALELVLHYIDDKVEGEAIKYHENGVVEYKVIYANEIMADGKFTSYHSNQKINQISIIKDGYLSGDTKNYSPEGKLLSYGKLSKGEQVDKWYFLKDDGSYEAKNMSTSSSAEWDLF